jgi:O-glycosyl hydrolase
MKKNRKYLLPKALVCSLFILSSIIGSQASTLYADSKDKQVDVWLTDLSTNTLLAQQPSLNLVNDKNSNPLTIHINEDKKYQQMVGFGADFTDSSAWLMNKKLNSEQKNAVMNKLFNPMTGIGLNFIRQPMGASDFSASGNYSYDDMPSGQTDPNLDHFSIEHDKAYIIPLLKQAVQLNPDIKIMGTPWSAPGWMKSGDSMVGGSLKASAYDAFANYFVKYVQAYRAQGLSIDYISAQNEPLFTPGGYPGMSLPAIEASNFIKNNLGPAFTANKISTKILAYDHNWDQPGYPENVLSDSATAKYVSGIAWHCYGGDISAQTKSHNAYPNKEAFMTECSGGDWIGTDQNALQGTLGNLVINGSRNWAKGIALWNMALDTTHGPINGGCTDCTGLVTIDSTTGNVKYNMDYYSLGHASKFVKQDGYRIASNTFGPGSIEDVAFRNPDGTKVLIAMNTGNKAQIFKVDGGKKSFSYTLNAGAAATFVWFDQNNGKSEDPASGNVHDVEFTNPDHSKVWITYDENQLKDANIIRDGDVLIKYQMPAGSNLTGMGAETALVREGWTASASSTSPWGDNPDKALDGIISTRWSSGQGLSNGDWYQEDMQTPQTFNQIRMDSNGTGDYARGYQVYVSNNGMDWGNAIASGLGTGPKISVTFPTQTARYIRVVQTGSAGNWWSINEFNIYNSAVNLISEENLNRKDNDKDKEKLEKAEFVNSDGSKVQVVYNSSNASVTFVQILGEQAPFTVTLPAGSAATFTSYKISENLPVPVLSTLSSTTGFARSSIIMTGTGFGSTQGISTVKFGATSASISNWSDNSIHVLVPMDLPAGPLNITVYVNGKASNTLSFTITTPTSALSRIGWVASASTTNQGDNASNMLDNNLNTRWSSGQGQSPGQSIQIDMSSQTTLNQIVMDSGSGTGDYARKYDVYVSNDGVNWGNPIANKIGEGPVEMVSFPSQTVRYLKIVNNGNVGNWWSIAEFYGMNN